MTTTTKPADCPTCMNLYPWTCAEHKGAGAPTVDDGSDEVLEEIERMIRVWLPNKTGPIDLTQAVANLLAKADAHNPDTWFDRSDPDHWLRIAKRRS
jgi:hypothetical protein